MPLWGRSFFGTRRRSVRWAYLTYNLMLLGSFLVIYLASTSSQCAAVRAAYRWGYLARAPAFSSLGTHPGKLVGWLISTRTPRNMLALSDRRSEWCQHGHLCRLVDRYRGILAA